MKAKIIQHAKENYSSSPHEFTDKELKIIIDSNCECYSCEESFEFDKERNDYHFVLSENIAEERKV